MQAIKNKLNDMAESRKVKAEVKEEEKAEKELAKARMDVAHEVRLAKEAEAEMDLHVHKAAEKAARFEEKYPARSTDIGGDPAAAASNISQRHNSSGKLDFS